MKGLDAMTHRSAARVAGILFIVATVAFSLSVVVLEPVLGAHDYLASVSSSGLRVAAGTLLELINHIAVVGIAVVIYPILRRFSERFAVGYVAARSIESVLFAIGTMHLVALANISHAFVSAGAPPASHFHTIGDMLLAGHDWDNGALLFTAFGLGALVLNFLLFSKRLVPRWLCGWGLVAAALILAARIMMMSGLRLGSSTVFIMDAPIMVQEMVFAVWLIVKGFNVAALSEGG
jgi:hypothetical protein